MPTASDRAARARGRAARTETPSQPAKGKRAARSAKGKKSTSTSHAAPPTNAAGDDAAKPGEAAARDERLESDIDFCTKTMVRASKSRVEKTATNSEAAYGEAADNKLDAKSPKLASAAAVSSPERIKEAKSDIANKEATGPTSESKIVLSPEIEAGIEADVQRIFGATQAPKTSEENRTQEAEVANKEATGPKSNSEFVLPPEAEAEIDAKVNCVVSMIKTNREKKGAKPRGATEETSGDKSNARSALSDNGAETSGQEEVSASAPDAAKPATKAKGGASENEKDASAVDGDAAKPATKAKGSAPEGEKNGPRVDEDAAKPKAKGSASEGEKNGHRVDEDAAKPATKAKRSHKRLEDGVHSSDGSESGSDGEAPNAKQSPKVRAVRDDAKARERASSSDASFDGDNEVQGSESGSDDEAPSAKRSPKVRAVRDKAKARKRASSSDASFDGDNEVQGSESGSDDEAPNAKRSPKVRAVDGDNANSDRRLSSEPRTTFQMSEEVHGYASIAESYVAASQASFGDLANLVRKTLASRKANSRMGEQLQQLIDQINHDMETASTYLSQAKKSAEECALAHDVVIVSETKKRASSDTTKHAERSSASARSLKRPRRSEKLDEDLSSEDETW